VRVCQRGLRGGGRRRTRSELEQRLHGGELPRTVGVGVAGTRVGRKSFGLELPKNGEEQRADAPLTRGLHSFTLEINLSAFHGSGVRVGVM